MTVPLSLIRAGIKLKALIPEETQERAVNGLKAKGVNVNPFELPLEQIDDFIRALGDLKIEASDDGSHFRLYLK